MKRNLTAVLALTVLASVFTACAEGTAEQTDSSADTASVTETQTEAVTEELRPSNNLPEMDFNGAVYRIDCCYPSGQETLVPTEMNGDSVNDLIFERNLYLTDTYNFTFEAQAKWGEAEHHNQVAKVILAGEDACELILGHNVLSCNNAIAGYYLDLYEVPYLDFTQPWWPAQSVEQMTVYDKMFTITSNATYEQFEWAEVIIFNKELLAANDIDLPYDSVRDGSWTMDQLISQSKGLYRDLNGDGKQDLDDQYGFITQPLHTGFLTSCDAQTLAFTEDGGREIAVMTEKMSNMVEMLYDWYYDSGDVFLTDYRATEIYTPTVFLKGNAAYSYAQMVYATDNYRDGDISYGIVPMPKYDTAQEEYYVWACPSVFSIPITCQNTEFAGFIFEAMSYYGYYDIVPAYYEQTLQGKIADAPDDAEMLTIIRDNLTASFAHCYDNWEGFGHLLGERLKFSWTGGSKDLASAYEKYKKSAQRRLDKVLAGFTDETD